MVMQTMLSFCQEFPEKTFDPGDVLIAEGATNRILYILIEGDVEVLRGDFRVSTVSEPGATLGETAVLLDIPATATVKALIRTRVHVIERAGEFLQSQTDIAYQLARLLAKRLTGITTYVVDLCKAGFRN